MTVTTLPKFDRDAFAARLAAIRAESEALDTSRTETVTMADLQVGDIVVHLGPAKGGIALPFPFTLSKVTVIGKSGGVALQAVHGWFGARPFPAADPVVRVAA